MLVCIYVHYQTFNTKDCLYKNNEQQGGEWDVFASNEVIRVEADELLTMEFAHDRSIKAITQEDSAQTVILLLMIDFEVLLPFCLCLDLSDCFPSAESGCLAKR